MPARQLRDVPPEAAAGWSWRRTLEPREDGPWHDVCGGGHGVGFGGGGPKAPALVRAFYHDKAGVVGWAMGLSIRSLDSSTATGSALGHHGTRNRARHLPPRVLRGMR